MSTSSLWALVASVLAATWVALGSLTAVGARRRGQRWFFACLSGLVFPLAWTVWYALDEPSEVRRRRRATGN